MASEIQLPEIHQAEVDGIPTLWSPVPGPLTGALQVRTGRADELRPISGITHLVEHLAFHDLMDTEYEKSGFVDATRTVFHASGHPHEVVAFLEQIARNLDALPLDRLDHERGILMQEASERGVSADGELRWLRYGPVGHGLVDSLEVGLDWLGPEPVEAWRRRWFTRGNAMLLFSGEPPAGLRLNLPHGARRAPALPAPDPDLVLPAFVRWERSGVGLTLVGERSPELTMLTYIMERRLKRRLRQEAGAIYDVTAAYDPLTGDVAHVFIYTECAEGKAAEVAGVMAAELDALATDGPTEEEIARELDGFERTFMDPGVGFGLADGGVADLLNGGGLLLPVDGLARRRAATVASARAVAATVRSSAILAGQADAPPAGYTPMANTSARVVAGREVAPAGWHLPGRGPRERLYVADEGLSLRFADGGFTTVLLADAVSYEHGSPTMRRLMGRDGFSIVLDADHWKDGKALVEALDRRVDPMLVACAEDGDNAGWARRITSL